jgi:ADP-ribose pyrophosphatase
MLKKFSDPALDEVFVSSKPAFDGKLLHVHVDTVRLPNGNTATREMANHQGAIAVVPILPDGSIIFVKQFRYPMGTVMYEIPAGKIDPGEEPDVCAVRELSEETGYEADHWDYLGAIATTPGFTDEVIHLYAATGLHHHDQHTDPDEFISVEAIPAEKLLPMIEEGLLFDSKSLAALGILSMKGII